MKYTFFGLILLLALPLTAQQELGTHMMRGIWQASYTNPALVPDHKLVIGLPGLYQNLVSGGVTYNDLVLEEGDQRIVDINNAIDKLDEDNIIRENLTYETISVGIRLGRFTLMAGHALRFNAFTNYPQTLPKLIWEGNAQYIGQTVDFGHDLQMGGYHELYLGAAVEVINNLTVGGRFKWLNGFADVSTDRNDLSLLTDEDVYALTLTADYRINSTGSLSYDGFRDVSFNYDFGSFDTEDFFTVNRGYAFDLGVHYRLGRLDFAASVLDLGKINWKGEVVNYSLEGVSEYQGLDIAKQVLEDSITLGSAIDTLLATYDLRETSNTYSTGLGPRVYLSATYQLTDAWRLGTLFYTERFRDEVFPAFAVTANTRVAGIVELGGLYAIRNGRFDNLGLNAAVTLGPVQVMVATDNLLTAFRPKDSQSMNLRAGLNLVFGREEERGEERFY